MSGMRKIPHNLDVLKFTIHEKMKGVDACAVPKIPPENIIISSIFCR